RSSSAAAPAASTASATGSRGRPERRRVRAASPREGMEEWLGRAVVLGWLGQHAERWVFPLRLPSRLGAIGVVVALTAAGAAGASANPIVPLGTELSNTYEQLQQRTGLAPLIAGLTRPYIQGAERNGAPSRFGHFSQPFSEPTIDGVRTTQKCIQH